MGMTDKQFNGYLRLVLDLLNEALSEEDETKRKEKFERLIDNLQKTIED